MKLIVGLGNPGPRYEQTRHNIGFKIIDAVREKLGEIESYKTVTYKASTTSVLDDEIVLLKPLIYMNRSGLAVAEAIQRWNIQIPGLLVIHDDLNLPLGKLRARPEGSSGGQNGMQSIIDTLQTTAISRLRIGIDRPPESIDWADYVLQPFKLEDFDTVNIMIDRAKEACLCWILEDIQAVMNKFN